MWITVGPFDLVLHHRLQVACADGRAGPHGQRTLAASAQGAPPARMLPCARFSPAPIESWAAEAAAAATMWRAPG